VDRAKNWIGLAVAVVALLGGVKAWILLPDRVDRVEVAVESAAEARAKLEGSVNELVLRVTVMLDRMDRKPPGPADVPPPQPEKSDNETSAPPPLPEQGVQRKVDDLLERLRRREEAGR